MGRSIRVLHVDDKPAVAAMTADLLERTHDRIEVVVEHSARDGIARLAEDDIEFDCVVSDYDMPRMDGLEFLDEIRDRQPDLPFILYTGVATDRLERVTTERDSTICIRKGPDIEKFERMADWIGQAVESYRTQY